MAAPVILRTDAGDEVLDLADFEARVRRGEVSPQSLVKLPAVTGDDFLPACDLELYRQLNEPRQAHFRRAFGVSRFPWLTSAFIVVNVVLYALTAHGRVLELDEMVRYGAKVGPLVSDLGELWRLVTANLLHRDALHVGVNMFVLFNVGGALENVYRTLDYLWLLVFTGVATMATSLVLNDAVTVGASGMVFGCLGGVVAFGIKYRSLLPARYRSIMGDAAIPTVLGLLFIGLTSVGVDNWAHVGGLSAGLLTGAVMRPRLLAEPGRRFDGLLRAVPTATLLLLLGAAQPLLADALPRLHPERDDAFGLVVPVPLSWSRGSTPLGVGTTAWTNGLSGLGRATFSAEALEMPEGADPAAAAARFVEERLTPGGLAPEVHSLSAPKTDVVRVADRDAARVRTTLDETSQRTRLSAYFVPRGNTVYELVFTWPQDWPRYGGVVEQMLAGLRFEEPGRLRLARAQAALFPGVPSALARLGQALLEVGDAAPAAEALERAVKAEPSNARTRALLSRARLSSGDVEGACEAAKAAVTYEPEDALALEADARCELAHGNPRRALEQLKAARAAAPEDPRLRAAEARLKAAVGE